jgi:8-oxo-dGTP diphosphatase
MDRTVYHSLNNNLGHMPLNKKNPPQHPQVAVGAVVFHEGKVLLVKRMKDPQKETWAIPGGSVNLGETLQEAAEREIKEETGLTIKAKKPVHTFDLIEREEKGRIRFHYVIIDLDAEYLGGRLKAADDALDAGWFSSKDLDDLAVAEATRNLLNRLGFHL